jgi:rhamnosyltransferase
MKPVPHLLAVLVLYNQKLTGSKTFLSLFGTLPGIKKTVHLLVYDNSPTAMHTNAELDMADGNFEYVSNTSNPGVSKAYNIGAQVARRLGCRHMLLLDQDTFFPKNAIDSYIEAIESETDYLFVPILVCETKIFSPCRNIFDVYCPMREIKAGRLPAKGLSILNSGMCVDVDAFETVGGFDESIPLDFADHDFFKRYRKHFESLLLLDIVCQHGFADKEISNIDQAATRFGLYCKGARNSIKGVNDMFSLLPQAFVRAVRLSVRFRSLRFLRLLLQAFSQ